MTKYQKPRTTKRGYRNLVGKIRGGRLYPVMSEPVRPSEGGMLRQTVRLDLDPIPGRLITDITCEVTMIFVPVQAMDALKAPAAAYAGSTDVVREKLLTGTPLFVLENESEISKRCGVVPRQISGVKKVNEMTRLAYICAVNHLRLRKYVNAAQLLFSSTAVVPALLSETILEKLNAVLDPEDRVNGRVALSLPNVNLPITNLWTADGTFSNNTIQPINADGSIGTALGATDNRKVTLRRDAATANILEPQAIFSGVTTGGVSLTEMYETELMDKLTREMRLMIDANPEYGEEMVLNWAHGFSVVAGSVPWVIGQRTVSFTKSLQQAVDTTGVNTDVRRTDAMVSVSMDVIVPKTELGGIVITLVALKPDETIASQPHPILSDVWGIDNFVADELKLDPVAVTFRDVDANCLTANETNIAMYVGNNGLKENYINYGFDRQVNPDLVENKATVWQLQIPYSVTPENVSYPEYLDHGVFAFGGTQAAPTEICAVNIESMLTLQSPMIVGPTPVEELAVLETGNLFPNNPL